MKKQKNRSTNRIGTVKFLQSLSKDTWDSLSALSNKRGITVQDYLRAIVIPNHLESLPIPIKKYSKRAKKAWATRRKRTQSLNKAIEFIKNNEVPTAPEMPKQ